jgi:hypothetical protein
MARHGTVAGGRGLSHILKLDCTLTLRQGISQ